MKIVFLDSKSVGEDIDLSKYNELGEFIAYDFSKPSQIPERVADADVIITNECNINEQSVGDAENRKLGCVTATGTNNLDKVFLEARGIAWRNVAGYSTESVAQHTFAMLFYLLEKLNYYDCYVKNSNYANDTSFTHFAEHFHEINGKTWGIIGLGNIGRRVADIAKMFGANVIYYSTTGRNSQEGYNRVDLDTLLATSDIVSVHAPLTKETENLMDATAFAKMKPQAIFINVGRGAIVNEQDLANAIEQQTIAAAGLDVLTEEPMNPNSPFLRIKDSRRLFITPHIAWASIEARTKLMDIVFDQIQAFANEI